MSTGHGTSKRLQRSVAVALLLLMAVLGGLLADRASTNGALDAEMAHGLGIPANRTGDMWSALGTVPDVVGMPASTAAATITGVGFAFVPRLVCVPGGSDPRVLSQAPRRGAHVPDGSVVSYLVPDGAPICHS